MAAGLSPSAGRPPRGHRGPLVCRSLPRPKVVAHRRRRADRSPCGPGCHAGQSRRWVGRAWRAGAERSPLDRRPPCPRARVCLLWL
eukprot:793855-Alexandrium_andersonii.AAC.1